MNKTKDVQRNKENIQKLVGISLLTALVVAFQLLSNYVAFGSVSITLALIPIAIGAILYGPLVGLFLGAVMGAIILTAPSTSAFLSENVWMTIVLCLVKTGVAGLVSGLIFKLFSHIAKNKEKNRNAFFITGIVLATLVIPILNTSIFILGASIFFQNVFGAEAFTSAISIVTTAVLTTNFVIEFSVSLVLSPALVYVIRILVKNSNLAFNKDFVYFIETEE